MTSEKERFDVVFKEGNIWAIQGPVHGEKKGTGKTTWAVQIVQQAIANGYITMGNVLFKSPIRNEHGKVIKWRENYPKNYRKVRSYAEVIYYLSESSVLKQRQRVMLVIDEAGMAEGIRGGAGGGMQTKEGVNVMNFAAQIRKLGMCIVVVGLGDKFLSGLFRADEAGAIITGTMRRAKLPGYDIREVIEVRTPSGVVMVKTVPVRGIARPQDWLLVEGADDGPVFDSLSPATFRTGVYRRSRKPFSLYDFLTAMSDKISEEVDEAVADFLEREGPGERDSSTGSERIGPVRSEDIEEDVEGPAMPDRADQIRALILAGNKSDSEIARTVIPPVSRQRVQQIRKQMQSL